MVITHSYYLIKRDIILHIEYATEYKYSIIPQYIISQNTTPLAIANDRGEMIAQKTQGTTHYGSFDHLSQLIGFDIAY